MHVAAGRTQPPLNPGRFTCTDIAAGIDVLASARAAVGMSLARHHDTVWLVPRHQPVTTATARYAALTVAEARLLRRIHRGEDVARNLSYPDRTFTLPALQRRGLVDTARSRPGLADVALESLDLELSVSHFPETRPPVCP